MPTQHRPPIPITTRRLPNGQWLAFTTTLNPNRAVIAPTRQRAIQGLRAALVPLTLRP